MKRLRQQAKTFLQRSLQAMPLRKKRIIFSSFGGRGYNDSPKYLYESLIGTGSDFEFVWALKDTDTEIPGAPVRVRFGGLLHHYFMATSGFWISNARIPNDFQKRPETIHLQLWHGTPLKKLGHDIEKSAFGGPDYREQLRTQTKKWDFLVSANEHSTRCFKTAFEFPSDRIWEVGYPRNDVLVHGLGERRLNELRSELQIPTNTKVVLYAPTWRDEGRIRDGVFTFDLQLDLKRLGKSLGEDVVVLLRMHYHSQDQIESEPLGPNVFDVSSYSDIQELYLLSDILVTDYSSAMFDFAHLGRPIILYMYDLARYGSVRGMYLDINKTPPGPISHTQDELEESLAAALSTGAQWRTKYESFYRAFCPFSDGNSSKRIADRLLKLV